MKPHAPKKLATLCALIGAGISCIGVVHAEGRVTRHNARPMTDVANRFQPATLPVTRSQKKMGSSTAARTNNPSEMSHPQYDNDQFEKLLLALQERETVPTTHLQNDRRKPAGLTATESAESASQDNAADAISATLIALSERRSDQFALDMHDVTKPLVESENGDAVSTASNQFVPGAQSNVLAGNQTDLPPVAVKAQPANSPAHEWLAVSDNSLDGMRGGFDTGAGLMVSFGIERAVYINGNLATSISYNIPDVSKLAADQARITANQTMLAVDQARIAAEQAKVAADQARLTADQARITASQAGVAAGSAGVGAAQTGVAAAQAGLSEQVRIASAQAKISSEQARLTSEQAKISSEQASLTSEQAKISSVAGATVNLVQNGPGNTFQPGPLPQTIAATVIQNTLNNQSIKSLTVINTTVNSMSIIKGLNAQASLRDALVNSLGIR